MPEIDRDGRAFNHDPLQIRQARSVASFRTLCRIDSSNPLPVTNYTPILSSAVRNYFMNDRAGPWACPWCPMDASDTEGPLRDHWWQMHIGGGEYNLDKHIRSIYQEAGSEMWQYYVQCSDCYRHFRSVDRLQGHWLNCHDEERGLNISALMLWLERHFSQTLWLNNWALRKRQDLG